MTPHQQEFPEWQQIVIVATAFTTGLLSLFGSLTILWLIVSDLDRKFQKVKYRFLLGLSIADLLTSIAYVVWALPIPKGTANVYGAMGNEMTCNAQGFVLQLSMIGAFYNAALSHYFYRSVCHNMSDVDYYFSGYEIVAHLSAVSFPCITALLGVAMGVTNYTSVGCWYGPYPLDCTHDDEVDCIRGENGFIIGWLFTGVPTGALLVVVAYCMKRIMEEVAAVVGQIRGGPSSSTTKSSVSTSSSTASSGQEAAAAADTKAKHEAPTQAPHNKNCVENSGGDHSSIGLESRVRDVAHQAYWYFGIYFMTHIFGFPTFLLDSIGMQPQFWLTWVYMATWPMQGFGNLFIFIRPRVANIRRKHLTYSYGQAVYAALFEYDKLLSVSERLSSDADKSQLSHSEHDGGNGGGN